MKKIGAIYKKGFLKDALAVAENNREEPDGFPFGEESLTLWILYCLKDGMP